MPNGKTIRQIADEIGVTRQAIYKKFKSNVSIANNIKPYSFTVNKVKYYTPEGEKMIKAMFADNRSTSQGLDNLSTAQLTHDNLTTSQVDRLSDELSGLQNDKTPIKSAFSAIDTSQRTVNLSTVQLTHDNLSTSQVDRLSEIFSAQLTVKDKQIEEKDRQLLEKDHQLAEKDKQIAILMEQSNNLIQALQAAQALAAVDKKQLLLQSEQYSEQSETSNSSENIKKGFFRKIFGK